MVANWSLWKQSKNELKPLYDLVLTESSIWLFKGMRINTFYVKQLFLYIQVPEHWTVYNFKSI